MKVHEDKWAPEVKAIVFTYVQDHSVPGLTMTF